jgi:hypothetical protein
MPYICIHNGAHCIKNNIWLSYETRQSFIRINEPVYRDCAAGKSQADLAISKEAS